jgi:hypothetical protein
MPDEEQAEAIAANEEKVALEASADQLPAIIPPQTKTPVSFNQQINNFQQIPPSAWDGLTPSQRMELSKSILKQMDSMDQRHYDYAVTQVQTETKRGTIRAICGSVIAMAGFLIAAYLGLHGQVILGLSISMPLATIIALVVGNRFLGK